MQIKICFLLRFIHVLPSSLDRNISAYVPHNRDWVKARVLKHLEKLALQQQQQQQGQQGGQRF